MMVHLQPAATGPTVAPQPVQTPTRFGHVEHTDTGTGTAFLALHGGMGGYDQSWLLARVLLADLARFQVLGVSRPGYLGTPLSLGETPEAQADLYAALLDALGVDRAFVAAVSAGGPSALHFALRHADRCRGLILVSTATGQLDVPKGIEARLRTMSVLARIPGVPALLRRKAEKDPQAAASRAIRDPAVRDRTLADPLAGPLLMALQSSVMHRLAARLPGTVNDTRRFSTLPAIPFEQVHVPVLVVHGTADAVVPFAHGEAVAVRSPQAQLHRVEGGEHVSLFTDLHAIRETVATFLSSR